MSMSTNPRAELAIWVDALDGRHRAYAEEYADAVSLGDPRPLEDGLDLDLCKEIRRRFDQEWRRRVFGPSQAKRRLRRGFGSW